MKHSTAKYALYFGVVIFLLLVLQSTILSETFEISIIFYALIGGTLSGILYVIFTKAVQKEAKQNF